MLNCLSQCYDIIKQLNLEVTPVENQRIFLFTPKICLSLRRAINIKLTPSWQLHKGAWQNFQMASNVSVITKKSINVVFFVVVILIKNEWGD